MARQSGLPDWLAAQVGSRATAVLASKRAIYGLKPRKTAQNRSKPLKIARKCEVAHWVAGPGPGLPGPGLPPRWDPELPLFWLKMGHFGTKWAILAQNRPFLAQNRSKPLKTAKKTL